MTSIIELVSSSWKGASTLTFLPPALRLFDAIEVGVEEFGEFFGRGTALELLFEFCAGATDLGLQPDLVERHAHNAALLADGLQNALANPPHGVGDEFEAARFVKFLCRFHQADVAFVDQVVERHALILILFGHRNHKAQVGFYQTLQRGLVAVADALGQFHLFVHREQFETADFGEILVDCGIAAVGDALLNL